MKRVGLLQFWHESNTFNRLLTGHDVFARETYALGDELEQLIGRENEVSGFYEVLRAEGCQPVPLVAAWAQPGGPVTRDFYMTVKEESLARLKKALAEGLDALLVSLHGAMVVDGVPEAQAEYLAAVREAVGPHMPIVLTLDFHANLNPRWITYVNGVVTYLTHPHEDLEDTGRRGARMLMDLFRHGRPYALAMRKVPALLPPTNTRTADPNSPMSALLRLAAEYEKDPEVREVSVFMGYPNADTPFTGAGVIVTAHSPEKAEPIAEAMAQAIWDRRFELTPPLPTLEEALREAMAFRYGTPVILGETSDSVLQGGASDGTFVLETLLRHKVPNAAHALIADPESVARAIEAGVGQMVDLQLGGKIDRDNFKPLPVRARVRAITDGLFAVKGPVKRGVTLAMGRTVRLDIEGIDVVVAENRVASFDPALLESVGIDPARKSIIALKGGIVARSAYGPLVKQVISFESPGWATCDYPSLPYRHVQRPIFPLDEDVPFSPSARPL